MTTQPLHRTIPTRLLALLTAALLLLAALPHGAEALGPPEHGHVLLLHATTVPNPGYERNPMTSPPVFPVDYERCVELANGRALPNHAHHTGAHTGRAGQALREQAGHLVVPLWPVGPAGWTSCAAIDHVFGK